VQLERFTVSERYIDWKKKRNTAFKNAKRLLEKVEGVKE
jgi:hypothetical protein